MSVLQRYRETTAAPCRSHTTGRFLPASRQLADRLDKVDVGVEQAFDALRPIGAMLDRVPAGPLGPEDVEKLRTAHEVLWSALDKIGDGLDEVRKLVGVANG